MSITTQVREKPSAGDCFALIKYVRSHDAQGFAFVKRFIGQTSEKREFRLNLLFFSNRQYCVMLVDFYNAMEAIFSISCLFGQRI